MCEYISWNQVGKWGLTKIMIMIKIEIELCSVFNMWNFIHVIYAILRDFKYRGCIFRFGIFIDIHILLFIYDSRW